MVGSLETGALNVLASNNHKYECNTNVDLLFFTVCLVSLLFLQNCIAILTCSTERYKTAFFVSLAENQRSCFCSLFRISVLLIRVFIIIYSVWSIYFSSRYLVQQLAPLQQNQFKTDENVKIGDNIGYKDYSEFVRYPQIDAVYTWVNGSDPIWYQEMLQYKKQYNLEHNIEVEEKGDTATSANRFRDNDELK